MRHEVPQFIDIEDKIFGPLTFKQAIYLAGSVGAAFAIYYGLGRIPFDIPTAVKVVLATPPAALGGALAFVKINKRPFVAYMEAAFNYSIKPKRYIWKKKDKKTQDRQRITQGTAVTVNQQYIPTISRSKIKDLAWSLDMETNE